MFKSLAVLVLSAVSLSAQLSAQVAAKPHVTVKRNVAGMAIAAPSVSLSCSAPATGASPDSYRFYRGTAHSGPYSLLGSAVTCSYTDSTVSFGTTYFYVATSVNTLTCPSGQNCESGFSNEATATVMANPLPNPPTGLTVTSIVAGNVTLQWNEAGTYTAFRVFRKPSARSWWTQLATGVKPRTYTDRNVPAGSYDYHVVAVNTVNKQTYLSDPSNVASATVQ